MRTPLTPLELEISRILYRHDPIGLARIGAPADEYDSEAQMIAERGRACRNIDMLRAVIWRIFVEMFDEKMAGPKEKYDAIAADVLKLLKDKG